jgi:FkbM family methyltransferase
MATVPQMWNQLKEQYSVLGFQQTGKLYLSRFFGPQEITIQIPGIKTPLTLRSDESDRNVLHQIFYEGDGNVRLNAPPRLIIDAGANIGFVSVMLANQYPDARIIAVEPDDENFRLASLNCKPYPNITLIKAGLWSSNVHLAIMNPNAQSWEFQLGEVDPSTPNAIKAVTVQSILEESGLKRIDYLKMDIEGGETQLFSHPDRDWIDNIDCMAIEIHGAEAEAALENALKGSDFIKSRKAEKFVFTRPVGAAIKERELSPKKF